LRDGRLVDVIDTGNTPHAGFVERIIGRHLESYDGHARPLNAAELRVRVTDLAGPGVGPLSFDMKAGEVLGLTGLIGSGCDDVPALLYGAREGIGGRIEIDGTTRLLNRMTPEKALAWDIVYLPADRMGEAGIGSLSIGDNIAMPVLETLHSGLGLTDAVIEAHAEKLGGEAGVRPNLPSLPLAALSGGNAQKALMAKWLQLAPKLLLLDEPTQGVDVGARQQLWEALEETAEKGTAILVGSTDYEQLARICHRVLIFARGQVVAELAGAELSKEAIAEHCYRSMTELV
ncbi:MAG: ATP-binding cassette domain-containing protein, partial [Geminicoccaceae bacterium]